MTAVPPPPVASAGASAGADASAGASAGASLGAGAGGLADGERGEALALLWTVLPEARLVGGAVRDMLAGREVADLDLATPEPPDAVVRRLADAGLKVVPTGIAHGTVTAVVRSAPFEITTLRRDLETDGRHAVVAFTDDWRADAARRDFTINAMFLDRAGTLHDYFGGAGDLAAGRVRFVGDPATRIREDHLRILRFFRFLARFGRGAPDAGALDAIAALAPLLRTLSPERVWSELKRLLATADDAPALVASLELAASTGVLATLLGAEATPPRLARLLSLDAPPDPVLRLAALTGEDTAPLAARLRLSSAEAGRLERLRAVPAPGPDADDAALRRLLADHRADAVAARASLAEADGDAPPHAWTAWHDRLRRTPNPTFPLAGRDAVRLGAPPGPAIGAALAAVRAWWLAEGATPDRAACLERLVGEVGQARGSAPGPRSRQRP